MRWFVRSGGVAIANPIQFPIHVRLAPQLRAGRRIRSRFRVLIPRAMRSCVLPGSPGVLIPDVCGEIRNEPPYAAAKEGGAGRNPPLPHLRRICVRRKRGPFNFSALKTRIARIDGLNFRDPQYFPRNPFAIEAHIAKCATPELTWPPLTHIGAPRREVLQRNADRAGRSSRLIWIRGFQNAGNASPALWAGAREMGPY